MNASSKSQLLALHAARTGPIMKGRDARAYVLGDSLPIASTASIDGLTKRGWLAETDRGWIITPRGAQAQRRLLRRRHDIAA